MEKEFELFLNEYESKVVALSASANTAYFEASISGKEEDYKKASELQIELNKIYADKKTFAELKKFKESDKIVDPILKRELELIYNDYLGNQYDEKLLEQIIRRSTLVEEKFSTFRASIDGKELTDNQIDEVLQKSLDSTELEKTWKASKKIGRSVADEVIALVKMRNESAQSLGFENYFEMSLSLSEQKVDEIASLFDKLDELTRDEFAKVKSEMDLYLSNHYSISVDELMPWHYQDRFFQLGPKIYEVDLDVYFKDKDLVEITKNYFNGIGLNIDDLIEKSDLFEKEGKYQHAYCTHIDRSGDVRVLCNIKPNYNWMGTMLHEYGHAAYDKFISPKLPWQLRSPAHIFTTEAIAMLFGRLALNPDWLHANVGVTGAEKEKISKDCFGSLRMEQLVFTRWIQVMFRFEKAMYGNPDRDLNKLWWELVEKYQLLKKPKRREEPDWASKIHLALYPAYYHNYMLGELLASQLYYYITNRVIKADGVKSSLSNFPEIGAYLENLFFSYGALFNWNDLIETATGEGLNPEYYAKQFVNK